MSKDKRKKELEKEMARLQKKLNSLKEDYEDVYEDEVDHEFMKDFDPLKPKKAKPPLPPLPPHPGKPPQKAKRHIRFEAISPEEQKRIAKEMKKIGKEKARLAKELTELRSEMHDRRKSYQDLRNELRQKEREIREKERELRSQRIERRSYSWDNELDDEIEVVTSDLEMRLGDYTKSILASVAESLKSSMGMAIKGAGELGTGIKVVGGEIEKIGKEIGEQISKDINVTIGPKIPEEKLEEFYEIGANIVAAIGDSNRLRILKELEKGPKYQKELSDITRLRGGTFKHHMDKLLDDDVKFVTQEVVRGRYFLTTRGREALKLAEIQYMRYLQEIEAEKLKKDSDSDEYDVTIK